MAGNKRVATKHIRDGIKNKYEKRCYCEICGTDAKLEFHHYSTVSLLLKDHAERNGISIATDKDVLAMRDEFYEQYSYELLEDTVTLCKEHHSLLHKTYGRTPPLHSAAAQAEWVAKARDAEGIVDEDFIQTMEARSKVKNGKKVRKQREQPTQVSKLCTGNLSLFKTLNLPLDAFKV